MSEQKKYKTLEEIEREESRLLASRIIDAKARYAKADDTRQLWQIAAEVKADWKKPYFGAIPYITAMQSLFSIKDSYGLDTAESVVLYFLSNATTWRGETARRIKAELKVMLKNL